MIAETAEGPSNARSEAHATAACGASVRGANCWPYICLAPIISIAPNAGRALSAGWPPARPAAAYALPARGALYSVTRLFR